MFNTNAQCYQNISQVLLTSAFILWPTCTRGFGIREKNPMRFSVFWRISVRFCGFPTPLTPPSATIRTDCTDRTNRNTLCSDVIMRCTLRISSKYGPLATLTVCTERTIRQLLLTVRNSATVLDMTVMKSCC